MPDKKGYAPDADDARLERRLAFWWWAVVAVMVPLGAAFAWVALHG